jgi:U3 small nucleolar RNA-associated protein 12
MKSGELVLYDIAGASVLETIEAHSGTIWSIHVRPDFGGVATGSADKDVKFWDFEPKGVIDSVMLSVEVGVSANPFKQPHKSRTLVHTRTLKMTDEVLAVKYSPNHRFLAVALLDATVRIFYQDSLKFFLSLYGHKVRSALFNDLLLTRTF